MAVYLIAMVGEEPFERLLADPEGAGLPSEVESAAEYNGFWLHVLWPQDGALNVIVEGDGDPDLVVGLLAQRVAGGGWEGRLTHVIDAEELPGDLEAGSQDQWVIDQATTPVGATEPATRKCWLCQWSAVPPHGPGCRAEKTDGGRTLPRPGSPTSDNSGGDVEAPEPAVTVEAVASRPERAPAKV